MRTVRTDGGLRLPASADSAGRARRFVRDSLRGYDEDLVSIAELCVSELVTNAVLHVGSELEVRVTQEEKGGVRLEVRDGSDVPPLLIPRSRGATTGRGLALVDTLATEWGVESLSNGGKAIWCRLAPQPDELDEDAIFAAFDDELADLLSASAPPESDVRPREDPSHATALPRAERTVTLVDYTVRRGMRLQEHLDAVRRECQLLTLSERGASYSVPAELLELSARMSSQYATERSGAERRRLEAYLRGDDTVDLEYPLRPETREVVQAWRQVMTALDHFCADQNLLTLALPAEMTELVDWVLAEVQRQCDGHPPMPWPGPRD